MAPLVPPFEFDSATRKVRAAEDLWNSRDPAKVIQAYTPNSHWRNRGHELNGRHAHSQKKADCDVEERPHPANERRGRRHADRGRERKTCQKGRQQRDRLASACLKRSHQAQDSDIFQCRIRHNPVDRPEHPRD